jgi:hypothetical protein
LEFGSGHVADSDHLDPLGAIGIGQRVMLRPGAARIGRIEELAGVDIVDRDLRPRTPQRHRRQPAPLAVDAAGGPERADLVAMRRQARRPAVAAIGGGEAGGG